MSEKDFQTLDNAVGLVEMLECLVENFSEDSAGAEDIPWKGMKLTLERLRFMLADLRRAVPQEAPNRRARAIEPEPLDDGRDEDRPLSETLAGRIQMAPIPRPNRRGYSRELGASPSGAAQPGNSKSQDTVRVDS